MPWFIAAISGIAGATKFVAPLAAFEWGWLSIFVACAVIALSVAAIILLTVWFTGGFTGRN
jgi:hypothetical protein